MYSDIRTCQKVSYEYIRIFVRAIFLTRIYSDIHSCQNRYKCHTLLWFKMILSLLITKHKQGSQSLVETIGRSRSSWIIGRQYEACTVGVWKHILLKWLLMTEKILHPQRQQFFMFHNHLTPPLFSEASPAQAR